MIGVKFRSVAVRYGEEKRENQWYADHLPEVLAQATERGLARAFQVADGDTSSKGYDDKMARYVDDPFRGARIRYKLGADETSLSLELAAAREALAAADLQPEDIDCLLVASWLPEDFVAPGNAVYLAAALGTRAPAFNVETACSSGLACLEFAEGLLAVGRYRRILVVLSNTVSRQADEENTLSWIASDVASAAVLEGDPEGSQILGSCFENTAESAGVFVHRIELDEQGAGRIRMGVGKAGSKALRASNGPEQIQRICGTALERAGVALSEVALFGCSTPLAWFAELCRDAMAASPSQINDLFPRLGNAGLPFPLVHLFHGLADERLESGDLLLLYTIGSTSTAGSMVVRVGDVACGPHPDRIR